MPDIVRLAEAQVVQQQQHKQLGQQHISSPGCEIARDIDPRTAAAAETAGEPAAAAVPAAEAWLDKRVDAGPLAGTSVVVASRAALGSGVQDSQKPGIA